MSELDHRSLAFVALGSNLGNSRSILRQAMDRLESVSRIPVVRSSLYRSTPVDCPEGSPVFVNAMAGLDPLEGETPESLLEKLKGLEAAFGRQPKTVRNEPRPLDLDLIAFGQETRNSPFLTLPHPRATERRFVLEPLFEISPDWVMPGQNVTPSVLLRRLPTGQSVVRLKEE